jgi:serine/threonine protein kinase
LSVGRRFCSMINRIPHMEEMMLETTELQNYVFVSPEVLLKLLTKKGVDLGSGTVKYEVGYASDIWSLACVLILLLGGQLFVEEIHNYYCSLFTAMIDKKKFDYVHFYSGWMERVVALLEGRVDSDFLFLKEILLRCLSLDPGNRPLVTDLRNCIRDLIVKSEFHSIFHSEIELLTHNSFHCIVLGNLCQIETKTEKGRARKMSGALMEKDKNGGKAVDRIEGSEIDRDVVEGLANGIKYIDLKGHFDSITGLAVGGGFLFSSSHDKIVNVWSLQVNSKSLLYMYLLVDLHDIIC